MFSQSGGGWRWQILAFVNAALTGLVVALASPAWGYDYGKPLALIVVVAGGLWVLLAGLYMTQIRGRR